MIFNYKLVFEHNGRRLETGNDFKIMTQEGMSASNYELVTEGNTGMDGSVVTNRRTLARQIELTGTYFSHERKNFLSFFNPKFPGTLTVTYNGVTRFINYEISYINFESTKIYREKERFIIRLLCPQPYFLDIDDFGQDIAAVQDIFAFPYVQFDDSGIITDYMLFDSKVPLSNKGDMPCGFIVQITAKAPVTNPEFINTTTGEQIEILTNMVHDDVLMINTKQREIGITLNGNDISMLYNPANSKPDMQLQTGENLVEYSAEVGLDSMEVKLFYRPMYLGV